MVRLKDVKQWIRRNIRLLFQFQNGAIKSFNIVFGFMRGTRFQFQNGAIKRGVRRRKWKRYSIVSIPKWCD